MTESIDQRLVKVQAFEIGKTYGGYIVESRTACFVTFEGCPRKKICLVDGVEQVNVDPSFSIAAFEEPVDAEPSLQIIATYDDRHTVATMTAPEAHAIATPIKVVEPSLDEVEVIAASLGYKVINLATAYSKCPMWRLMRDGAFIEIAAYGMGLTLFDVRAYLEAERHSKRFDFEVPSAIEECHAPVLGRFRCVIRDVPSCGYAIAEPVWYKRSDDPVFSRDIYDRIAQMREEINSDRAANFELRLGGLI